ncbi:NAD(P)-dependent oxidoreductase, partial [Cohnella sp. GbtcB17]|uniref:NAD(P)-dependent oxidoreductase n=1 Tax=Cohnella sp. GbtcB17 TaxID=2824762 RepID=UPI0027D2AA6C
SLNELFERSDIVSWHNTRTPRTVGMIGAEQLARLRDGARFVNTARGPVVQGQAHKEGLRDGRRFAALGGYASEPLA